MPSKSRLLLLTQLFIRMRWHSKTALKLPLKLLEPSHHTFRNPCRETHKHLFQLPSHMYKRSCQAILQTELSCPNWYQAEQTRTPSRALPKFWICKIMKYNKNRCFFKLLNLEVIYHVSLENWKHYLLSSCAGTEGQDQSGRTSVSSPGIAKSHWGFGLPSTSMRSLEPYFLICPNTILERSREEFRKKESIPLVWLRLRLYLIRPFKL